MLRCLCERMRRLLIMARGDAIQSKIQASAKRAASSGTVAASWRVIRPMDQWQKLIDVSLAMPVASLYHNSKLVKRVTGTSGVNPAVRSRWMFVRARAGIWAMGASGFATTMSGNHALDALMKGDQLSPAGSGNCWKADVLRSS
jgi:hypothetical protein